MNQCSLRLQDNKMRLRSNFQTLWNGRRRVFVRISLILARRGQTCQECPTCKNRHKTSFGILLSAYLEFRMTWHDELFEFRQQHERLRLGKISHRNRKRFVKKSKKSQFICSDNESSQLTLKIFLTLGLFRLWINGEKSIEIPFWIDSLSVVDIYCLQFKTRE